MRSFLQKNKNAAIILLAAFLSGSIITGSVVYFFASGSAEAWLDKSEVFTLRLKDSVISYFRAEEDSVDVDVFGSEDGFLKDYIGRRPYESSDPHEEAVIRAIENAEDGVVSIVVSKDIPVIESCNISPFGGFNDFTVTVPCKSPSGKTEREKIGGGSGFIVSEDGLIITNKHVVGDPAGFYTVFLNNGKKYEAKIAAVDKYQDIAILKIEASGLKALRLGDSDSVRLGQTAIAIGNALGEFQNTVSVGVVSGKGRSASAVNPSTGTAESIDSVFQTDAAINPGNSGGPLLNLKGEVIGINTAVVSGAQSIGFAIPANRARRAIESYRLDGNIKSAFLGVRYMKTDEGALIKDDGASDPGIVKGSPAEKSGLKPGDIIIEADGKPLDNGNSLSSVVAEHSPGDSLRLKVKRGEEMLTLTAVLEERK